MLIVIVGCGHAGSKLARMTSLNSNNVVVNGISIRTFQEAGVEQYDGLCAFKELRKSIS